MIIFDYGGTLMTETVFEGIRGYSAILKYATDNPYEISPEELKKFSDLLDKEMGRKHGLVKGLAQLEYPEYIFQKYIYDYFKLKFSISNQELEQVYWEAASPAMLTPNIESLLNFLEIHDIKIGVISNIPFQGITLKNRIEKQLTRYNFEFIISTCDYGVRKPSSQIFELALRMSNLNNSDVWYCGDNFENDIIGGKNANLRTIFYKGKKELCKGEYSNVICINDWNQIIRLLEPLV